MTHFRTKKIVGTKGPQKDGFIRRVEVKWEKVEDRQRFPWSLPMFVEFESLELDPQVTILVGENGSGKSTLIEGIAEAIGINSEGGSRNHNFDTTGHRSRVAPYLRIVRGPRRPQTEFFLRAESLFNVATAYEEMAKTLPDLHLHSHGEGFIKVLKERFGACGLYLLDEPESALSPQNILTLICRMHQLVQEGAQFIVATHSPILMAYPGARVLGLSASGIEPVDYRTTDHFLITKRVLGDPDGFLRGLLNPESS